MGDGELRGADWVGEIYVEGGVAVGGSWVLRWGRAGGMPEVGKGLMACQSEMMVGEWGGVIYRFEDARTRADNICTAEFFSSNVEHAL